MATGFSTASSNRKGSRPVALVTGGTGGIGLAIASATAEAGYDVVIHGLSSAEVLAAIDCRLAQLTGAAVLTSDVDLSSPVEIEGMIQRVEAALGRIDVLVNAAGVFEIEPIDTATSEQWRRTVAVNLSAAFHTIRLVLPGMKARRFGRIVSIASALGLVGQLACSAYAASKHGIVGLTRAAALEVAESGITVNAICPGYVRTSLVEEQIRSMARSRGIDEDQAAAEIVATAHPTRRFVDPSEIAALTIFLASPAGASITGAAIPVDGGWTCA